MIEIAATTILPAWLVVPMAGLTMIGLAGHVMALREVDRPGRRQRIRIANGMLMLTVTPLLAYVFAFATPDEPRLFLLVWVAVTGLLGMILMLTMMDVGLTMRRHRAKARRMQIDIQALRDEFAHREQSPPELKYHPAEPDDDGDDA